MKLKVSLLLICAGLQSCSKIDDYMLGKDNTPAPKPLKEIVSQTKVAQNWAVPIGKSHRTNDYLKLKPVIQHDVVYTADVGGLVQAVNKNNGTIIWSKQLKHGVMSGPTVNDATIALGTNDSSIVLLSLKDGHEIWENKVSSQLLSKPVFAHQKVIAKTINGKVYAFNTATGKELWSVEHGSPNLILKASSSPIILGNLVLVGFSDGKMDAYEIDTGALMWQRSIAFSTGSSDVERLIDIDADPIIHNNIAYIASYQGYIGALSLESGQFIWKKPGSVYKNTVLKNNSLFVTDSNDVLWSLDSTTGAVNWKQTAFKARGLTEPVVQGNQVIVGDREGFLHVLDSKTGDEIGRSALSGGIAISPNVSGKNVYVVTENGILNKLSIG